MQRKAMSWQELKPQRFLEELLESIGRKINVFSSLGTFCFSLADSYCRSNSVGITVHDQCPHCRSSQQHRSCFGSHAYPELSLQHPDINKTSASQVRLPILHAFGPVGTDHDGGVSKHLHIHRFRYNLLQVRRIQFHSVQVLRFRQDLAVVIDEHEGIVENRAQRFNVPAFLRLVPGMFQRENVRPGIQMTVILRRSRQRRRHANQDADIRADSHSGGPLLIYRQSSPTAVQDKPTRRIRDSSMMRILHPARRF